MRTITAHERDLILDITGEGLTPLPAGAVEKDLLITEVLHKMAEIDDVGLQLIFCGGTCLSKAHGLIGRMSEDIDFKVVVPEGLSRSLKRKRLGQLKTRLISVLCNEGFIVPEKEVIARDENGYICINIHYDSRFGAIASLRPEIKLELSARPLLLPFEPLLVRSILALLVEPVAAEISINCLGVQESIGEKVLSFLRRTAETLSGKISEESDDRLIRHIYDVSVINRRLPDLTSTLSGEIFQKMVMADAERFISQFPEFRKNPVAEMHRSLEYLENNEAYAGQYNRFVEELVYGDFLSFEEAIRAFISFAQRLLLSINDKPERL